MKIELAPLVGYSDVAFRLLARSCGAQMCHTQMIDVRKFMMLRAKRDDDDEDDDGDNGNIHNSHIAYLESFLFASSIHTRHHIAVLDRPLIAQLGGSNNPFDYGAVTEAILEMNSSVDNDTMKNRNNNYCAVDGIELNLGCPQNCARNGGYGSFLLEDTERAVACVRAISTAIQQRCFLSNSTVNTTSDDCCRNVVPVATLCKIRCFTDIDDTVRVAVALEHAGCQVLTVHGRTRSMGGSRHTGKYAANWNWIKKCKEGVGIPVIANGDIITSLNIEACLQATGCDAVMSGVSALRHPHVVFGNVRTLSTSATSVATQKAKHPSAFQGGGDGCIRYLPSSKNKKVKLQEDDTRVTKIASAVKCDNCDSSTTGIRLLDYARRCFPEAIGSKGRCRKALALGLISIQGCNDLDAAQGKASARIVRVGDTVTLAANTKQILDRIALVEEIGDAKVLCRRNGDDDDDVAVLWKPSGTRSWRGFDGLSLENALGPLFSLDGWKLVYDIPRVESGIVLAVSGRRSRMLLQQQKLSFRRTFVFIVVCDSSESAVILPRLPMTFCVVDTCTDNVKTLTTLEATIDETQSFEKDVANIILDAGLILAGSRVKGSYGRGNYVSLVAIEWSTTNENNKSNNSRFRVDEPLKFASLRKTLHTRAAKKSSESTQAAAKVSIGQAHNSPLRNSNMSLPLPPTSSLECAVMYLKFAVDTHTPPDRVYAHLVGKLALVNQKELKAINNGVVWARLASQEATADELLPIFTDWLKAIENNRLCSLSERKLIV